ncbi:MAG: nicotinate-nucleotide--dimethylbenzimidazole phosphoribosyltransferase [Saprospiraceae bacterium]|nr:nicotinate-nucleotide--dimethylbenzimidazole phosphoribosyltransferase [Saprospiraceae bacterium]
MTYEQVIKGISNGYDIVDEIAGVVDIIGVGEMGIGNTSIASLLISIILNIPIEEVTGVGAGLNEKV